MFSTFMHSHKIYQKIIVTNDQPAQNVYINLKIDHINQFNWLFLSNFYFCLNCTK